MGIANGFRQAAYRSTLVVAGGVFIALGGWLGWRVTYSIAAGVLLVCALTSLKLPHVEVDRPKFSFISLMAPAKDLLERPGVFQVAMFILLFKLGDMAIGPMIRPFWLARGLSTTEIGLITGTMGVLASIAGGLTGGLFMASFGIYRGLWTLGVLQSMSNLSYVIVSAYPNLGSFSIYMASTIESFCRGVGFSRIPGLPDEYLQERILRHPVCLAFRSIQNVWNNRRGRQRVGNNRANRIYTLFPFDLFCVPAGFCVHQKPPGSGFHLMELNHDTLLLDKPRIRIVSVLFFSLALRPCFG